MISGFDFGTSNCAMGIMEAARGVRLLPLEQGKAFMPSTLYALDRELICEHVAHHIPNDTLKQDFVQSRKSNLLKANRVRQEEGFGKDETSVFFGREALDEYYAWPGEGYFVKSPKSFLGASGLRDASIHFFEDVVTAMMMAVKQRSESVTQQPITKTVIGRPVNFQGLDAQHSNQQALGILSNAAKRAGFEEVEFLYEPIGAALSFEQSLQQDKTVLVMDVGGGTTDCAMVRMGPSYREQEDREQDFLGHTGERIGGNDLDIQLSGQLLMPLFGMLSTLKNGLPMPTQAFWNAVRTNDVGALAEFNSVDTLRNLQQLLLDTTEPETLKRFLKLRAHKQNHHVVRQGEMAKIALSKVENTYVDLDFVEEALGCNVSRDQYAQTIQRPLNKMLALMTEAIEQAGEQPDLIFVTGGSGQSPILRQAIFDQLGHIEILDGDHFGSVTSGLTVWANKIFR